MSDEIRAEVVDMAVTFIEKHGSNYEVDFKYH